MEDDRESPLTWGASRVPEIHCIDGFTMSVQASSGHYCSPRSDEGPYTSVEVGFPNREEPLLMRYAEDETCPTETVYGWVPLEVVQAVVESHGGTDIVGQTILRGLAEGRGVALDEAREYHQRALRGELLSEMFDSDDNYIKSEG